MTSFRFRKGKCAPGQEAEGQVVRLSVQTGPDNAASDQDVQGWG